MSFLPVLYFVVQTFAVESLFIFDYGKGMRSSDGKPLQCFEVAEYDGIYYPATAEVVGDQVKVYSKEVPNPRYVRYGWQPFTRANLINREGLPASTFRAEFSMK